MQHPTKNMLVEETLRLCFLEQHHTNAPTTRTMTDNAEENDARRNAKPTTTAAREASSSLPWDPLAAICLGETDSAAAQQQQQQVFVSPGCCLHKRTTVNVNDNDNNTRLLQDAIVVGRTRMRDASGGAVGTIQYVGPVASSKRRDTQYAGIQWDDVQRGKHNGSVACRTTGRLVQHFDAGHATGASFVKLDVLDLGRPLTRSVLQERYVPQDTLELVAPDNRLPHHVRTASGRPGKAIEFLGELQIRERQQWTDLRHLALRRAGLCCVDCQDWLSSSSSSSSLHNTQQGNDDEQQQKDRDYVVTDLDVAGNLFADWSVLPDLMQVFPSLARLSLAYNRLSNLSTMHAVARSVPSQSLDSTTNHLQTHALVQLNLNRCWITDLETLVTLGTVLPVCTDLSLTHNFISRDFDDDNDPDKNDTLCGWQTRLAAAWPELTDLDLSSGTWRDETLAVWAHLPALTSLALNDNSDVERLDHRGATPQLQQDEKQQQETTTSTDPAALGFGNLVHLQMAGTALADWCVVDAWRRQLPKLQVLRLSRVPLLSGKSSAMARRLLVVARLPELQVLNASPVTEQERREAARAFVRQQQRVAQEQTGGGNGTERLDDEQDLVKLWLNRYPELAPTQSTTSTTQQLANATGSLALIDSVMNLSITSLAPDSCTVPPLCRRLPRTLLVQRLKALCARHFGLDPDLQSLHYTDPKTGTVTFLAHDEDTLDSHGLVDGAQLFLTEGAPPEASVALQDWEARMEKQEAHIQALERGKRLEQGGGGGALPRVTQ